MKWTSILIATATATLLFAAPVEARDIDFGLRAGIWFDESDAMFGLEAITPITNKIFFNPNVEVIFRSGDDEDVGINLDAHYDFDAGPDRFVWAGAGIGALLEDEDEDIGVNVLGGMGLDWGSVVPYAQLKVFFADDNEASLAIGVRF